MSSYILFNLLLFTSFASSDRCEGCEGLREGVVVRLRARQHTRRVLPRASPGGRVDDRDVSSGGNAVQRFDAKGCGKVEVRSEIGFETKGV